MLERTRVSAGRHARAEIARIIEENHRGLNARVGGRDAFALASVLFGPPRMRVWIRREPIGLPTTLEARMGDTGERVFFEVEYEVDPEGARRF